MLDGLKKYIKKKLALYNLHKILVNTKDRKVIYIGSPLHGNIGDHAISISVMNIFKELKQTVIEIPGEWYRLCSDKVKKYINDDDVIFITGGGFIGNLWLNEEEMIIDILRSFKNNKVVILPQTIYFKNDDSFSNEYKKLKEAINNHNNLYLCCREEMSYKYCKENFKVKNLLLFPDLVLSLNYETKYERNNILMVMRKDKEKIFSSNIIENIISKEYKIETTDTVCNMNIKLHDREDILNAKLNEFAKSKLIITDRLHGMIFAAITSTPCIAFDNLSKKVSGVYHWLKKLDYIVFCDDIKAFKEIYKNIDLNKIYNYSLGSEYKSMFLHFIKNLIRE